MGRFVLVAIVCILLAGCTDDVDLAESDVPSPGPQTPTEAETTSEPDPTVVTSGEEPSPSADSQPVIVTTYRINGTQLARAGVWGANRGGPDWITLPVTNRTLRFARGLTGRVLTGPKTWT